MSCISSSVTRMVYTLASSPLPARRMFRLKTLILVSFVTTVAYLTLKDSDTQTLDDVRSLSASQDTGYILNLFQERASPISSNQYIVYRCVKGVRCGGWADRQKGIVAAYIMSVMTRRKYRIILTTPCDVTTYLLPVEEDWRVQDGELDGLNSSLLVATDHAGIELRKRLATDKLEDILREDVTYITSNMEYVGTLIQNQRYSHLLKWTRGKSLGDIYKTVWKRLFKLNERTERHLHDFQNYLTPSKRLICAQIRLGTNPTIPLDNHKINTFRNVQVVWDFLSKYNNSDTYQIFIATDSEQVRNAARRLFPGVEIDVKGDVVHVERSRGDKVCSGWEKVILDQIVLTYCDVLVISQSGLGRIAALMRQSQDDLYYFKDKQITLCNGTTSPFKGFIW